MPTKPIGKPGPTDEQIWTTKILFSFFKLESTLELTQLSQIRLKPKLADLRQPEIEIKLELRSHKSAC